MDRKENIDTFGAVSLVLFSALLGFNQVAIKVGNEGFQPVFMAGLRSTGAVVCIWLFIRWRQVPLGIPRHVWPAMLIFGTFFGTEFIVLFLALDLTTVARTSVIFYSMPVWLAIAAHFYLPGERMTTVKAVGLILAFAGVCLALLDRPTQGDASLMGDILALLSAFLWAGIAFCARGTSLRDVGPENQLFWQVLISAPILLGASLFFGPFFRDIQPMHWANLLFQIVAVSSGGFMFWLWLLKIYPASSVAAFGFLAPVFGVFFGWALLDEPIGMGLMGALCLVALGLFLINRPQVPQKV